MRPIDADALIKELKHITDAYGGDDGDAVFTFYDPLIRRNQLVNMEEFIKRCPTIDPVKRGKWIFENRTWFHQPLLKCSCCGRRQFLARFDYCPYCGARMDGE